MVGGDAENPKFKDSSMDSGKRRDRSKDMYEVAFGFGLVLNGLYGAKLSIFKHSENGGRRARARP